jgi:hypothetical protein
MGTVDLSREISHQQEPKYMTNELNDGALIPAIW